MTSEGVHQINTSTLESPKGAPRWFLDTHLRSEALCYWLLGIDFINFSISVTVNQTGNSWNLKAIIKIWL